MASQFQLIMRTGPTPGVIFTLEDNQLNIGRDNFGNEIVINDVEVSRRHARLIFQGGTYMLEDLGSTNGTFVNGQRLIAPRVLKGDEVVSIGEQIMLVFKVISNDPDATMVWPRVAAMPSASHPEGPPLPPPADYLGSVSASLASDASATLISIGKSKTFSKPWPMIPPDFEGGPTLWFVDQNIFLPLAFPEEEAIEVGRSEKARIILPSPDINLNSVSRVHAKFEYLYDHFFVQDIASTNGTRWNETELFPSERAPLKHGDTLMFSELRAIFLVSPAWVIQHRQEDLADANLTYTICNKCHYETLAISSFCPQCGARFSTAPQPEWRENLATIPESPTPIPFPPPPPVWQKSQSDMPEPPTPSSSTPFPPNSNQHIDSTLPLLTIPSKRLSIVTVLSKLRNVRPILEHDIGSFTPRRKVPPASPSSVNASQEGEELRSPILDDQPSKNDQLGFSSYCTALRDIILHPKTKTPLTLGIFGRWGTGKTTLMRMLEGELKMQRLATVWFNAWQYDKEEQLWAAFLQVLINRIRTDLSPFQRVTFGGRLLRARIDWDAAPQVLLLYLFRAFLASLPLIATWPISQQLGQVISAELLHWGGGLLTAGVAGWLLIKPVIENIRENVKLDFGALRKESSYEKHIAFLDSFREHFQDVVKSLPIKGDKRLAIFVDDLDRCSPEGTLQVLDAIKLFLDIPGCIFILGVDVDVVQKAVASKYKDDPLVQQEYLGKIVQLPFYLPTLSRRETRHFVEQIVPQLPDGRCRSIFVEGLATNPREIKRAISVFTMLWSLVAHRSELSDTIKPVRLAKVVVLRHSYPALYRILESNTQLLIDLENYFRYQNSSSLQKNEDVQSVLPKTLEQFANVNELKHLLLLFSPIGEIEDETCFSRLGAADLVVYFTLTRESSLTPQVSTMPGSEHFPNLGERYDVRSLLGHGGMSDIYLAWDKQQQQSVAIKVVHPYIQAEPKNSARLQREIQILYRLDHPNIVRIYDNGIYYNHNQSIVYYAMEYLEGETLKQMLKRQNLLSPREAFKILGPILEALAYIHKHGIIHRDLKPSAIGFTSKGVPKLMDLGIARMLDSGNDRLTQTGAAIGTPGYMAPEQVSDNSAVDYRADLYSFGVVLFECLTGRRPFQGDSFAVEAAKMMTLLPPNPQELNPALTTEVSEIVLKLLEKDPKDRFGKIGDVYYALKSAIV